jgi:hypothetical protein
MLRHIQTNTVVFRNAGLVAALILVAHARLSAFKTEEGASRPTDGRVIGWQVSTSTGVVRRYLVPTDACYARYRNLPGQRLESFASPKEAEAAGYSRRPYALRRLGKYVGICSGLYEYFIHSTCEREAIADDAAAVSGGYLPIERFEVPRFEGPVPVIAGSGRYRTACDPDYACLLLIVRGETPTGDCRQVLPPGKQVEIFDTERSARDAGHVSVHEALHSEFEGADTDR